MGADANLEGGNHHLFAFIVHGRAVVGIAHL
jgi:hypothetical protein